MADDPGEAYQSLYRRYRPQRFADVRGQEHVTVPLRNAVRQGRVAHAYLFSGPRGTGKTSTARILAMALDCEHPLDGEPDGECSSCTEIRRGASLDVQELDAASNRRLDEMRDLLSRVSLGTRGQWKVYIIDEVHQLTPDAASALLKTLEEPPPHVVFVLATTDPQKVLPTIRSRTQHFEFRLLPSEILGRLLVDVNERAGLGVPPEAIDLVVRRGHGSARDALSVLDQVAAAGATEDESSVVTDIVEGLAERDPARVLMAVAEGTAAGREPRRLATDLLEHLRNGFLALSARGLVHLPDEAAAVVEGQARRLGLAGTVRALEAVGAASADLRDSIDPRVTLEVALVRVASPAMDVDPTALLARIERLEALLASVPAVPAVPAVPPATSDVPPATAVAESEPEPASPASPAAPADLLVPSLPPVSPGPPASAPAQRPARAAAPTRAPLPPPPPIPRPGAAPPRPAPPTTPAGGVTIGALRRQGTSAGPSGPGPAGPLPRTEGPSAPAPAPAVDDGEPGPPDRAPAAAAVLPSRDELTKAWGDTVLIGLPGRVKAYMSPGRFVAVEDVAVFALPDAGLVSRAADVRADAEAALAAHFGRAVPLRIVLDEGPGSAALRDRAPVPDEDPSDYDLDDLSDVGPAIVSPEQRLLEAFPGAEEVPQ